MSLALVFAFAVGAAAAGYWSGFRDGLAVGVATYFVQHGSISAEELRFVAEGRTEPIREELEYDVDNGLLWAHALLEHPLRKFLSPVWGLDFYSDYRALIVPLADYRREHATEMSSEFVDPVEPASRGPSSVQDLQQGVNDNLSIIREMVEMYSSREIKAGHP